MNFNNFPPLDNNNWETGDWSDQYFSNNSTFKQKWGDEVTGQFFHKYHHKYWRSETNISDKDKSQSRWLNGSIVLAYGAVMARICLSKKPAPNLSATLRGFKRRHFRPLKKNTRPIPKMKLNQPKTTNKTLKVPHQGEKLQVSGSPDKLSSFVEGLNEEDIDTILKKEEERLGSLKDINLSDLSSTFITTIYENCDHKKGNGLLKSAAKNSTALHKPWSKDLKEKTGHDALRNLSYHNRFGKYQVYGRGKDIATVLGLLASKVRGESHMVSNPTITGPAGTGKTALIKHLAWLFATNQVPPQLRGYQLLELDLKEVMNKSAKWSGLLERQLSDIFKILEKGKYILFIDEIHNAVGTGATANNSIGILGRLKDRLTDKNILVIGATTTGEYQRYIATDPALKRRLSEYKLRPLPIEATLETLQGIYEKRVTDPTLDINITARALRSVPPLCEEYLPERGSPARDIHVVETALQLLRERQDASGAELLELKEKQRANERALRLSQYNQSILGKTIRKSLQDEANQLKRLVADHEKNQATIEKARQELDELRYEATRLLYNKKKSQEQITEQIIHRKWSRSKDGLTDYLNTRKHNSDETLSSLRKRKYDLNPICATLVEKDDILEAISRVTGIPALGNPKEAKRLMDELPKKLRDEIVGQDHVVEVLSAAYNQFRAGFHDRNRPLGVFLFLGPSGVGKTAMAQAFNKAISLNAKYSLIKLDMGDFSHPRLMLDELAKKLEQHPHSVVLLDEFFKGYSEVYTAFMGVLDSGYLTNSKGNRVCCRQAYFFLTSNAGSKEIVLNHKNPFWSEERESFADDIVNQLIATSRAPAEFFGRIDNALVFDPLSPEIVREIVDQKLRKRCAEWGKQKNISLSYDSTLIDVIAEKAYNPLYGAREVNRTIDKIVLPTLIKHATEGQLPRNILLRMDSEMKNCTVIEPGLCNSKH